MRTFKRVPLLLVLLVVMAPAPAHAWWGWLEELSGPGRFIGYEFDFRLYCLMERAPLAEAGAATQLATRLVGPLRQIQSIPEADKTFVDNSLKTLAEISQQLPVGLSDQTGQTLALDLASKAHSSLVELVSNHSKFKDKLTKDEANKFNDAERALDRVESFLRWTAVPETSSFPGHVVFARCSDRLRNELSKAGYSGIRHADRRAIASLVINYRELANTKLLPYFSNEVVDKDKGYAGGHIVHLRILEPKLSWAASGRFDFLDAQAGLGIYWFSSEGLTSFSGFVVEPIRLDFHLPGRLADGNFAKRVLGSLSYSAGVMLFPGGFSSSRFKPNPGTGRDIAGGEALLEQGIVINVGRLFFGQ